MRIGVILPTVAANSTGIAASYKQTRSRALRAESLGFDSIWINDHLLFRADMARPQEGWRYPHQLGAWEGWTWLCALAEATTSVDIGAWVMCTGFRNPALLAKMAVALDEVSGGRHILGVGAGWGETEHRAFGFPFDHLVGRFEEAMSILGPLVRDGWVDFEGRYYTARDCSIDPVGPRPDGPPILIGADGPRMLRLTARFADMWNAHYLGDPDDLARQRAALDAACEAEGRDPATIATTVGEFVVFEDLAPTPDPNMKVIRGSVAAVTDLIGRYAELGVSHLMLQCVDPGWDEALERLGESLAGWRAA
jgi:alkanesulfonate monooxygenase SsuD/methylene tetrahydromethanopterin reductase-like flavin-dependent oxidoreductase (luciferase family)